MGFNQHLKQHVTTGLFAQNFAKDSSVVTVQYLRVSTRHCTTLSGNHVHTVLPGLAIHHVQQYRTGLLYTKMYNHFSQTNNNVLNSTCPLLFPIWLRAQLKSNLLIYLLTPCSRVLLEKLTGSQLVKFPAFYGTRRLITAITSPRHLSLSWARLIQSMPPHPTSWRSYCPPIYAWIFQVVSYPQVSPPKPWIHLSCPQYVLHTPPISFLLKDNIKMYSGQPVVRYSFVKLTKCKNTSFW